MNDVCGGSFWIHGILFISDSRRPRRGLHRVFRSNTIDVRRNWRGDNDYVQARRFGSILILRSQK